MKKLNIIDHLKYWKERCLAAERYIEESPCDPDIYKEQFKAYLDWLEIKNNESN